jgi:hypothetical protein
MPDGDTVHSHLGRRYQYAYKILCEGVASSEECGRSLLEKLRQYLRETEKWSLLLSRNIADLFSQSIGPLAFSNPVEAARISRQIDELRRKADGPWREKELMKRASKSLLNDLRDGQEIDCSNPQAIIFERFIQEVYEADFKERIPLSNEHHADVSHRELQRRIENMEPYLYSGIRQFAQAAIKSQNLNKLRLPQRQCRRGVDLDENLLAS